MKSGLGRIFNIWDIGGQDKTRPLWRSYTRATDAIIFVVDSSDKERLEEAKLELQRISRLIERQIKKGGLDPFLIFVKLQSKSIPFQVKRTRS